MQETLIDQGISLMIYGMGTVFVFLTILVFATSLMSKLVSKFAPAQTDSGTTSNSASGAAMIAPPINSTGEQPNPQVLEAIKQAISQHRQP